jgi:hypothetical protein
MIGDQLGTGDPRTELGRRCGQVEGEPLSCSPQLEAELLCEIVHGHAEMGRFMMCVGGHPFRFSPTFLCEFYIIIQGRLMDNEVLVRWFVAHSEETACGLVHAGLVSAPCLYFPDSLRMLIEVFDRAGAIALQHFVFGGMMNRLDEFARRPEYHELVAAVVARLSCVDDLPVDIFVNSFIGLLQSDKEEIVAQTLRAMAQVCGPRSDPAGFPQMAIKLAVPLVAFLEQGLFVVEVFRVLAAFARWLTAEECVERALQFMQPKYAYQAIGLLSAVRSTNPLGRDAVNGEVIIRTLLSSEDWPFEARVAGLQEAMRIATDGPTWLKQVAMEADALPMVAALVPHVERELVTEFLESLACLPGGDEAGCLSESLCRAWDE